VILGLAGLIVTVEAARHHEPVELLVLSAVLGALATAGLRLVPAFSETRRTSPSPV
jgi:RsiW-degrading membrane proteinase PrsW (M82 family)